MHHPRLAVLTSLALAAALSACGDARPVTERGGDLLDCNSCHGMPPQTPDHPPAGDCVDCHASTVDEETNLRPGGTHMNGEIDLVFGHATGMADPVVHGPLAAASFATCAGCHENHGAPVSCTACHTGAGHADWLSNCTFCHGERVEAYTPASLVKAAPVGDAHARHLLGGAFTTGIACGECHAVPADVAHVDARVEVSFGALAARGTTPTYAAGTCTVACHGAGIVTPAPEPRWTDAGPLACEACHGARPATGGGHGHRMEGWQGSAGHVGAPCASCHKGYVEGTSVDLAIHVDGRKTVVFDNRGGTTTTSTSAARADGEWDCGLCHTSGAAGNANAPVFGP
jgi:predicted CxxxxCH...CXXCH cytochrome family protein